MVSNLITLAPEATMTLIMTAIATLAVMTKLVGGHYFKQ